MGDKWIFTLGIAGGADIADPAITASRATVLASVKDYLQVQGIPLISGEELF